MPLHEHLELPLTRGSEFAESAPLLAKVGATFSLAAEVMLEQRGVPSCSSLPDLPFADDTVFRRALEVFLHRMRRGGDPPGSGPALSPFDEPGLKAPPGPRSDRPDPRFTGVAVPGGRTARVLTRLDLADAWTTRFHEIFRAGLTEPGSRYDLVRAEGGEVETIRGAVGLLERLLPHVAASVLAHLSFIGVVDGPGAFESASDRKVPRAVFISRAALTDVPRTAEAILHECVHQKLYDIQLLHPIYRPGYDAATSPVIRPPWHDDAAWSFDRSLAAAHVYVHLTAFYAALQYGAEPEARHVDAAGGRRRTAERAAFLLDAVAGVPGEAAPAGRRFIAWLTERLAAIESAEPAAAAPAATS